MPVGNAHDRQRPRGRGAGPETGAPVIAFSGRGFANDLPTHLGWSYLDAERFPDFLERRRVTPSSTDVYRSYGIEDYHRLRTTIFPRTASESEAAMLMLRPGTRCWWCQKIDVDPTGRPLCFSESVWAGDRVQFIFENEQPKPGDEGVGE